MVSFDLTPEQTALRDAAREFAQRHLWPKAREVDESERLDAVAVAEAKKLGLYGYTIPPEYGGTFHDSLAAGLVAGELWKGCGSTAASIVVHGGVAANHVLEFASEDLKRRYLPRMASGELPAAWALTEPETGSDAMAMRTTAIRKGEHYLLNGTKHFITNGAYADAVVVMAKTGGKISAFLVESAFVGFERGSRLRGTGVRASGTSQLHFNECKVPAANLIGKEGDGGRQVMKNLDSERLTMGAIGAAGAEQALDTALAYAKERRAFGRPIYRFQAVYGRLAEMHVRAEAANALWTRAAWLKDTGKPHAKEASMAKMFGSQASVDNAWDAMQVLGGNGFMRDYPVERFLRNALLGPIGGGTADIQKMVIARGLGIDVEPTG